MAKIGICLSLALLSLLLVAPAVSGGGEEEPLAPPPVLPGYGQTIWLREFKWDRPANFFREYIDRDATVCVPLLRSLNKPYNWEDADRPSLILLHNDYLVPWRKKRYAWESKKYGTSGVADWPQIIGDIDGGGEVDAVYLRSASGKWNYFDHLFFSEDPQPDELSDEVLSFNRYREIYGETVRSPLWSPQYGHPSNELTINYERMRPYLPNLRGIGSYQDIVSIAGHLYVLNGALPAIFDTNDPAQVDPRYLATVTLFAVHSNRFFDVKCQFLAKTLLVVKGRKP